MKAVILAGGYAYKKFLQHPWLGIGCSKSP